MGNKITEKYFTQTDFSRREEDVLAQVVAETGFVVEKEIFRGMIYDTNKVGSLIYKGTFKGNPAVLKFQGLKPEIDEAEIIKHFTAQNQSKLVRVPLLYAHAPWAEDRGYGYLITEYLTASPIFTMPFVTSHQMQAFAKFYQEYKTSALISSWIKQEVMDSSEFSSRRVKNWVAISKSKGRLEVKDYESYLEKYYVLAKNHFSTIPMEFCHGHLTANDIYQIPDGSFVVLSNLYWSYRPQWYDLAFNIWRCLLSIRDTQYTFSKLVEYVDAWLAVYSTIPIVKKDENFNRKITMNLLERTMGAILVDLGVNDIFEKEEDGPYFKHLLDLHQQLFNYLAEKLK